MPGTARGPTPEATLVLGGNGFLGSCVVAAAGSAVVLAGREAGSDPRLRHARFLRMDALVPGELERLLESVQPGRVVVCTALSNLGDAERYPALARALNVEFPRRVAGWCGKSGARLVHVSTDLVFGAGEPQPGGFREEDEPTPLSEYGRSKAAGEAAVLGTCSTALVVRLPLLYGDSFGRARGASDGLLAAIERGERPTLFTDEWRTPLEVSNAAVALVELSGTSAQGILHVAGPERVTRYELALAVLRSRGLSGEEARARILPGTRAEAGVETVRARDASLDARRALGILSTPLLAVGEGLAASRSASRGPLH